MQDGAHRRVVRIGETVRRPVQPWTPSVHALLRHLEEVGFAYAPRPLGIDGEGREVLTFIEGDSGAAGWAKVVDDQGLRNFARLLRDYHEACAGFSAPPGATWSTGAGSPATTRSSAMGTSARGMSCGRATNRWESSTGTSPARHRG